MADKSLGCDEGKQYFDLLSVMLFLSSILFTNLETILNIFRSINHQKSDSTTVHAGNRVLSQPLKY